MGEKTDGLYQKKESRNYWAKSLRKLGKYPGKDQDIVSLVLISFFASSSGKDWEEDPELVNIFW